MKYIIIVIIVLVAGYFILENKKPQEEPVRLTNEDINNFFTGGENVGQNNAQDTIHLYSTAWCGYCKKARNILIQSGVRYKEYDIEKDAMAYERHKKLGGRGVPLIEANGKLIKGYNEQILKELVADKRYQP
ncbi:hypothetical protein MTZ49_05480 [Entomomonas sp. E2T0]|uniref:glutaredoxin domain-containing protein n=1 Tax=Entomomonas sp. E2T0 TaxID=2930213 RepID=UPI00222845C5|nr:glutaredoxin domain-containing protein [Entomomonas sp. E2T0]UYZ85011.1 hypothetical protein MTZ49_05480 [Entomomonas sp. E2T0]